MSLQKEKTPAFKIFHFFYEVIIPQHHLYSNDYLKEFGIPTSGDSAVDKEMANSPTYARKTIAQLAELVSEGASITLSNPEDSVQIYETIQAHLKQWNDKISRSPVDIKPPLEDLRLLDELAGLVFQVARRYMKESVPEGYFEKLSRRNSLGMNKKRKTQEVSNNPMEHKSLSESINKAAFSKIDRW